jgi:spore maturation protein SpmB
MSLPTQGVFERIAACADQGARKGLRAVLWLLSFILPASLAVTLLVWTGALGYAAQWLEPAFKRVGLPGEAALAWLTAALLNNYAGIAAMGAMSLDSRQVTILAMVMLISHNLPIEVPVQHKAGSSGVRILALRLAGSVFAAVVMNWILPAGAAVAGVRSANAVAAGLAETLEGWAIATAWLSLKIVVIVIGLMILQRILAEFGIVKLLSRALSPLLWLLGLPKRTAFLWIVSNTLGLAYGAGVIFGEVESGAVSKEEVELLNRSIAICHSLLEDTLLFIAVGAWAFWITVPRLILAAGVVWTYRAWRALRGSSSNAS